MTTKKNEQPQGTVAQMNNELRRLSLRVAELETALSDEKLKKIDNSVSDFRVRLKFLFDRHQLLLWKVAVATEVNWYIRRFHPDLVEIGPVAALWAFEQPDDWWEPRTALSLGAWVEELVNEYLESMTKPDTAKRLEERVKEIHAAYERVVKDDAEVDELEAA